MTQGYSVVESGIPTWDHQASSPLEFESCLVAGFVSLVAPVPPLVGAWVPLVAPGLASELLPW